MNTLMDRKKVEETSLPAKEQFYSSLKDTTVSDDDYQHVMNVFTSIEITRFFISMG